jgi:hypothetical protein
VKCLRRSLFALRKGNVMLNLLPTGPFDASQVSEHLEVSIGAGNYQGEKAVFLTIGGLPKPVAVRPETALDMAHALEKAVAHQSLLWTALIMWPLAVGPLAFLMGAIIQRAIWG